MHPLLKCLWPEGAILVLEIHERMCKNDRCCYVLLFIRPYETEGYYWLTMLQVGKVVMKCQKCKLFSDLSHTLAAELMLIINLVPFTQ